MAVIANPEECTTPEAWAELVRGERESALKLMAQVNAAQAEIARLRQALDQAMAKRQSDANPQDEGA